MIFRFVATLNNLFALLYATLLLLIAMRISHWGNRQLLSLGATGIVLVSAIDIAKMVLLMSALSRVESGMVISVDEIATQAALSQFKWTIAHFALFLYGLAMPRSSIALRWLAAILVWVQLPLGLAVYAAPAELAMLLSYARLALFAAGVLLLGRVEYPQVSNQHMDKDLP